MSDLVGTLLIFFSGLLIAALTGGSSEGDTLGFY